MPTSMRDRKWFIYFQIFYLTFFSLLNMPPAKASAGIRFKCLSIDQKHWTIHMSKGYARAMMPQYKWNNSEFKALNKLWTAESHWNPKAYNTTADRWSGKHAAGIPQILGMNRKQPAPAQIEQGLAYIKYKYGKPSTAWAHHRAHGWY